MNDNEDFALETAALEDSHAGLDPDVRRPRSMSRRQLLQLLGVGGAGVAFAAPLACSGSRNSEAEATTQGAAAAAAKKGAAKATPKKGVPSAKPIDDRVLVLVEFNGGNDGFATLVPYGDANFRKLRDRIWVDRKDLHPIDDRYAVPKGLEPITNQLAFIEGVGVAKPDLSHFAMLNRWWYGDPDGTGTETTGFLGRCCDVVAGREPVTGVSIGGGSSATLISRKATTVSLPKLDGVRELTKNEPGPKKILAAIRDLGAGRNGLGNETTDDLLDAARTGLRSGLELAKTIGGLGDVPKTYPEGNALAGSLASIRQLISAGSRIRVFHVPFGSFDTHSSQVGSHNEFMNQFGAAVAAFRKDLEANGLADRVLLATTSEFGRRAEANNGGTDHGTASTMLLVGALKSGRHGIAPDFTKLDDTGNVKATVSLSDYYATLANWLGISPSDVLKNKGVVIDTLRLGRRA